MTSAFFLLASAVISGAGPVPTEARETQPHEISDCLDLTGDPQAPAGMTIERFDAASEDLPGFRVTVTETGAWMKVYYDPVSENAAGSRAACLGAQIARLGREVGDDRRDAEWDSVVFSTNKDYAPPRGDGTQGRWTIATAPDGALDLAAEGKLIDVIPHEQTHDFQRRNGARAPRWFHEGHATWIGLKVTSALNPVAGVSETARQEAALTDAEPLRLAAWGGVQVKPEAILRQLTPEDRARKLADPSFQPAGPFSFGPGDVVSDESNSQARYAGAWKIFQGLEARHGADAVSRWVRDLTAKEERVSTDRIVASARNTFGEDLAPLLE